MIFSVFMEQELVDYLNLNRIEVISDSKEKSRSSKLLNKIIRISETLFYKGCFKLNILITNYLNEIKFEDLPKRCIFNYNFFIKI